MDAPTIPPDPEYLGKENAASVPMAAWREYAPLNYEVSMLAAVAKQIDAMPDDRCLSDGQRVVKNALIESFALHFRNLAEFLWPERTTKKGNKRTPQPSDAVVRYFAPGWSPPEPTGLNDLIERVGREIGHLTTYRRSGDHPSKRWDVVECIRTLQPLAEFVRQSETKGTLPAGMADAVTSLVSLVKNGTSMRSFERLNATTHLGLLGLR